MSGHAASGKRPRRPHAPCQHPGDARWGRELFLAQIYRRGLALLAAFELEGDLLAFPQIADSRPLDGRDMNKHVLGAVIGLNKSIALLRVEPLYRADSHSSLPSK